MRRLAALLMLTLLLAAPAGAQEARRIQVVKAPPAASALRGAVDAPPEPEPGAATLAALIPLPPPVAPTGSQPAAGARQCRSTCARDYYFCLASEDESTCSPIWVKCQARCGA